jgi:hypothetical protein
VNRLGAAALVSGLVLVTAACGGGDDDLDGPDPTAPGVDLSAELLAAADLPTGWEQTEAASAGICLERGGDPAAEADTAFVRDGSIGLTEAVYFFDEPAAAQEAYSESVGSAEDCADGEISFPRIGIESSAFELGDVVLLVARRGDRLVHLALTGSDPDELEPIARLAVDKLAG